MAAKATVNETKTPEVKEEQLVSYMAPYIEGEDPDETVIINGQVTKFKKGVVVKIKPNVAEVLANRDEQRRLAQKNREKFKHQVQEI